MKQPPEKPSERQIDPPNVRRLPPPEINPAALPPGDTPEQLPAAGAHAEPDAYNPAYDDEPDEQERRRNQDLERDRLLEEFQEARNRYAFQAAGRASRTFHIGWNRKFSRKDVAVSKEQYRVSRAALIGYEVMLAYDDGEAAEIPKLYDIASDIALRHDGSLARALEKEYRANSFKYDYKKDKRDRPEYEDDDKTVKIEPTDISPPSRPGKAAQIRDRFTDSRYDLQLRAMEWWGKQSDGSKEGKIKKAAVTTAMGLGAAAVAAVTAPLLGGALGAAGAAAAVGGAAKISRSRLVFQLDRGVSRRNYLDRLNGELNKSLTQNAAVTHENEKDIKPVADLVEYQSSREAKDNHKRAAIAAAAVIGGTVIGELVHLVSVGGHAPKPAPVHHPGTRPGGAQHQPGKPATPSHPPATHHASKPHAKAPAHAGEIYVSAKNIGKQYVSQVYEHAMGFHRGFTEMVKSAGAAIRHGDLVKIQPDSGNSNLWWYKVTKKGAELYARGASGSSRSVDVMKVLSHFGRVAVSGK